MKISKNFPINRACLGLQKACQQCTVLIRPLSSIDPKYETIMNLISNGNMQ